MTAINVLLQREAGHLVTDAAWYDLDGVVQNFGPKSQVVAHWPGAIAARGPGLANAMIATEAGLLFADFDAFADGAAAFLQNWCEREADHLAGWLEQGHVEVIAIGWSRAQDRPRAIFVSSKDETAEAEARGIKIDAETMHLALPYQVLEIDAGYVRPLPTSEAMAFYKVDPEADFDELPSIAHYAAGIVCAQRELREPLLPGGEPVCFVGGYMMMTTITRHGVSAVKGIVFPDVPGRRISAQRADVILPAIADRIVALATGGMTRQQRRAAEAQAKKGRTHA
ncbi:hypothetical protein CTI14_02425 [Methylobacterium radiotolerans]|nr:hypothetical protein CTI14_02425 [Methylobacterium radiotolerans]